MGRVLLLPALPCRELLNTSLCTPARPRSNQQRGICALLLLPALGHILCFQLLNNKRCIARRWVHGAAVGAERLLGEFQGREEHEATQGDPQQARLPA